jgi:cytochrome c oxidase cbb3-type subunit I/II
MAFGVIYWLLPRLWKTKLYSQNLANFHFWIGTLGILFYAIPLYWAGWAQASMWKQFSPDGNLVYGNFLETVTQILPMYMLRAFGGALYLIGVLVMVYNTIMTVRSGSPVEDESAEAPALKPIKSNRLPGESWHYALERKPIKFTLLSVVAVAIGGAVEIIPTLVVKSNIPTIESVRPLTALEVEGRDIYIREGCNNCHSQMIRPFRSETVRYGEYSKAGEYVYDHPFLWGSKRTGPDLHRVGGKYNNAWHFNHMLDPRSTSPGSIMPRYPWLFTNDLDASTTSDKIATLETLGVPYSENYIESASEFLSEQAQEIANDLNTNPNIEVSKDKEIIALIAYLQRLGTDIKTEN